ncbi:MAG TPA: matrixin family metalloprotease [Nitrosopumilaceae archaeon]|nr:matrixin family metalloprotease [Nitrosopumilaceae archaeon]
MISGQINFYIEPLPSFADPEAANIVEKFANYLDGYGITGMKFNRVYDTNDADIDISWIKDWGGHTQGLTIFKSVIQVGLGKESCYGEWQPFDSKSVMEVLFHEFGHSMGFKHSSDPNNIMYPITDTRLYVDYDKSITFNKGYVWHTQFCGPGSYYYEVSSDDQYNGFDVYVAPSNSDYNGIISGKDLYYRSCSTNNKISYSHTCIVEAGSSLWIYNHNDNPTNSAANQIHVKIIDMNQRKIPDLTFNMADSVYDKKTLEYVWNKFH